MVATAPLLATTMSHLITRSAPRYTKMVSASLFGYGPSGSTCCRARAIRSHRYSPGIPLYLPVQTRGIAEMRSCAKYPPACTRTIVSSTTEVISKDFTDNCDRVVAGFVAHLFGIGAPVVGRQHNRARASIVGIYVEPRQRGRFIADFATN
jgi:hypothetical protein